MEEKKGNNFGYFKAISEEHSKIKAAMFINKFEIASGYYISDLLTSEKKRF
jgi:hypothetical protein